MEQLSNILEAILFVSGNAVDISDIAEKLAVTDEEIAAAVAQLKAKFSGDSGIGVLSFNGKLQFASNPAYAKAVECVLNPIKEKELTNAMLETLAVIAYKQPITRLDVEDIRGVDCTYSVQNLVKLGMIEGVGRKDAIGKPVLYATTDNFLKRFSLSDIYDLPDYQVLLDRLKEVSEQSKTPDVIEKPMFDDNEIPEFLKDEDVAVVE
jgi:segregation and condensation protein B